MLLVVLLLSTSGAALLVIAGYILGANRSTQSMRNLLEQSRETTRELQQTRAQLVEQQKGHAEGTRANLETMLNTLVRHTDTMQKLVEPLTRRDGLVEGLRNVVQQALAPLAQRDRLALELSDLPTDSRSQTGLTRLLDEIAEKGQFWAVLLSDRDGLPLAASNNSRDLNKLTALSSLILLLAERIGRNGAPAPLSVQIHDEADMVTLCRIFQVNGQQLLLTAVSTGAEMSARTLDPALMKINSILSRVWSSTTEAIEPALSLGGHPSSRVPERSLHLSDNAFDNLNDPRPKSSKTRLFVEEGSEDNKPLARYPYRCPRCGTRRAVDKAERVLFEVWGACDNCLFGREDQSSAKVKLPPA